MTDLDQMTPEEMCAGLMRGLRSELRLGYDWESATRATASYKGVEGEAREDLFSFAKGVADGFASAVERAFPERSFGRVGEPEDRVVPYADGFALGKAEDGFRLYPALRESERVAS